MFSILQRKNKNSTNEVYKTRIENDEREFLKSAKRLLGQYVNDLRGPMMKQAYENARNEYEEESDEINNSGTEENDSE